MAATILQKKNFIALCIAPARLAEQAHGVPAAVLIAQAVIESEWGLAAHSVELLNPFGIRQRERADGYCKYDPSTNRRPLRKFRSFTGCFSAHASLIANSIRYAGAMAECRDAFLFAWRIWEASYAPAPASSSVFAKYFKEVDALMTQFDLYRFNLYAKQKRDSGAAPKRDAAKLPVRGRKVTA